MCRKKKRSSKKHLSYLASILTFMMALSVASTTISSDASRRIRNSRMGIRAATPFLFKAVAHVTQLRCKQPGLRIVLRLNSSRQRSSRVEKEGSAATTSSSSFRHIPPPRTRAPSPRTGKDNKQSVPKGVRWRSRSRAWPRLGRHSAPWLLHLSDPLRRTLELSSLSRLCARLRNGQ